MKTGSDFYGKSFNVRDLEINCEARIAGLEKDVIVLVSTGCDL